MVDLKARHFPNVSGEARDAFWESAGRMRCERDELVEWCINNAWSVTKGGSFVWVRFWFWRKDVPLWRLTNGDQQGITVFLSQTATNRLSDLAVTPELSETIEFVASLAKYYGRRGYLTDGKTRIKLR